MLSLVDVDTAGVGCSAGCGLGESCVGCGVAGSTAGVFAGRAFGVFSGSGVGFFFAAGVAFGDLLFSPLFFLPDLDFGVADGVLDGFADGVGCRGFSSSSDSVELEADFFFAGEPVGFAVSAWSSSGSEGVFFGRGVGVFFFFRGLAVGVGLGVFPAE